MKILLTGMTGFAGSYLAEEILTETDWEIYSLERLNRRPNLLGVLSLSPKIHRLYHDFRAPLPDRFIEELAGVDYIIHSGAEVHGIRSLMDPELIVHASVVGTFHMLEAARKLQPQKLIYISSAEAVGGISKPHLGEEDIVLQPSNPYAAAKAAAEMLCLSYVKSFSLPVSIVRTMCIFGPGQDTSKFIPGVIKKMLAGEMITLHIGADGTSGSRQWLSVYEFVKAVYYLLENSQSGEVYHVIGPEKTNEEIISRIGMALGIPWHQQSVVPGRSHDMRYAIKDTKIPSGVYCSDENTMFEALADTVQAYKQNQEWLQ